MTIKFPQFVFCDILFLSMWLLFIYNRWTKLLSRLSDSLGHDLERRYSSSSNEMSTPLYTTSESSATYHTRGGLSTLIHPDSRVSRTEHLRVHQFHNRRLQRAGSRHQGKDIQPSNTPDLNPMDYLLWSIVATRYSTVDAFKTSLTRLSKCIGANLSICWIFFRLLVRL